MCSRLPLTEDTLSNTFKSLVDTYVCYVPFLPVVVMHPSPLEVSLTGRRYPTETDLYALYNWNVSDEPLRKYLSESCAEGNKLQLNSNNAFRQLMGASSPLFFAWIQSIAELKAFMCDRSRVAQSMAKETGITLALTAVQRDTLPLLAAGQASVYHTPPCQDMLLSETSILSALPPDYDTSTNLLYKSNLPVLQPGFNPNAVGAVPAQPRKPRKRATQAEMRERRRKAESLPSAKAPGNTKRDTARNMIINFTEPPDPVSDHAPRKEPTPAPKATVTPVPLPEIDMSQYDIEKCKGYSSMEYPAGSHPLNKSLPPDPVRKQNKKRKPYEDFVKH